MPEVLVPRTWHPLSCSWTSDAQFRLMEYGMRIYVLIGEKECIRARPRAMNHIPRLRRARKHSRLHWTFVLYLGKDLEGLSRDLSYRYSPLVPTRNLMTNIPEEVRERFDFKVTNRLDYQRESLARPRSPPLSGMISLLIRGEPRDYPNGKIVNLPTTSTPEKHRNKRRDD